MLLHIINQSQPSIDEKNELIFCENEISFFNENIE
jgi:hypothetical protein